MKEIVNVSRKLRKIKKFQVKCKEIVKKYSKIVKTRREMKKFPMNLFEILRNVLKIVKMARELRKIVNVSRKLWKIKTF